MSEGSYVLTGSNAQGKTSILEAIYLLAIAKSFRADNEGEVVNWKAASNLEQAIVDGVITNEDGDTRIIIGFQPSLVKEAEKEPWEIRHSARKEIRIEGVRRSSADLVGLFNVVLFSPEDITLVQGAPSLRRRFLDILISQFDPSYLKSLRKYQRILLQRNQLLKLINDGRSTDDELLFWDSELATEGAQIIHSRDSIIDEVGKVAGQILDDFTGNIEKLNVYYNPNVPAAEHQEATRQVLQMALRHSKTKELSIGHTVVGPHRDDFKLIVNGADMNFYSSRGQARTLALTLKLAEATYLQKYKGAPMILLDDVLSELDSDRRLFVLDRVIHYGQTLITTTDLRPFTSNFLHHAKVFSVAAGVISAGKG